MGVLAKASQGRIGRIVAFLSILVLAACDALPVPTSGDNTGQRIDPKAPVTVALLVPGGSGQATDNLLAKNFENAARMAIADQTGAQINLKVYNTAGNPTTAAAVARAAVEDGAKIILGPLYAEAANAVGVAVRDAGVNVLAFSNNASIAGGNVFILGATFENTANRLVLHSKKTGKSSIMVAHAQGLAGEVGRDAILSAANRHGITIAGVESYPFSQQGIVDASSRIASQAKANGADSLFLTAGPEADLPFLATALPENGLNTSATQLVGLTRWSAVPQALALPGLQGGVFTLPDQNLERNFSARYQAAYTDRPHPLAGLSYDGIAAISALIAQGNANALTSRGLTRGSGFVGTQGIFRLLSNGTNERGLAVAQIRNNQVSIIDPAPKNFSGAGF
ncbi:penicillin-binding protein activator [Nereida sp. MMG025]|uniref:penicillin-binding protein activator n=1 Tax=Nereida sp. MMG025 TaxID=2909981 RepID=UPI001F424A85|nr:penicillin-binding protein activator [Nereida sp. MMG025]MCF6445538.1 penicillin-binding protein activator [Nereida sp. MMG025]